MRFMRALTAIVVVFALLAFDLAENDSEWFRTVNAAVNDLARHASLR